MIIKVCGMRQGTNIRQVEAAGADWLGFIFAERSPRRVCQLPDYLPQHARRVGVFVDAALSEIQQRVQQFGLHMIQLHGHETPDFCQQVRQATGLPLIRAVHIDTLTPVPAADYLLFDTGSGGTGQHFDWDALEHYHGPQPFLLAGGISLQDAERIKALHHPLFVGVDLNSRFETAPGMKDAAAIQTMIARLRGQE